MPVIAQAFASSKSVSTKDESSRKPSITTDTLDRNSQLVVLLSKMN
jgi:hypothetical protein